VEYGLIGELENPKIYGAGLLSSIGESKECIHPHVKKMPYTMDAYSQSFDITQPQPQLYVARDFNHLNEVLLKFSESMAYRTGGEGALKKALNCGHEVTIELSSGAQICGKVDRLHNDEFGHPVYLNTGGSTCLGNLSQPILNQDFDYHPHGFGMPLGNWKSVDKNPELLSDYELRQMGIGYHRNVALEYESGVRVEGEVFQIVRNEWGKLLIISFKDCTVCYENQILFNPDWGIYDLVVGADVVSVFVGLPRGFQSRGNTAVSASKTTRSNSKNDTLMILYQQLRTLRELGCTKEDLAKVVNQINFNEPNLWLLMLECFELAHKNQFASLQQELEENLKTISQNHLHLSSNILDGMNVYSQ
jgi:phenylalanine-4-hydroxylase